MSSTSRPGRHAAPAGRGDADARQRDASDGWDERRELERDHRHEVRMLAKCVLALVVVVCVILVRQYFLV